MKRNGVLNPVVRCDVGNDDRFSYKLVKAMIALYKQGMIKYNGTDYHSYNLAKA